MCCDSVCWENVTKGLQAKVLHLSFLRVFSLRKQVAEPYADVGVMLSQSKFLADFVADDVVALFLDELSYILAFQTECVEAAIADFPVCKSFLLEGGDECRVAFLEDDLC